MATDDSDDLDLLSLLRPRRAKPAPAPSPTPTPPPAPAPPATSPPPVAPAPAPSPDVPAQAAQGTSAPQPAADPSDDEDDPGVSIRTSGRRSSRTATATARAASSPDVPIASVRVGTERLLDSGAPDAHLRRVASVTEAQRWTALREHLAAAGPDLRWRALGWVLQQEIAFAERVIQDCRRPRRGGAVRPRKADAVEAATQNLERLVAKVEDALSALGPELAHLSGLVNALDRAGDALGLARTHLAAVCGEGVWMAGWAGCDVGTGIPGYDTPENIDAHRARVQDEVARFQARRGAEAQQRHQRTSYVEPAPKPAGIVAGLTEPDLFAATTIQASAVVDPDDEE